MIIKLILLGVVMAIQGGQQHGFLYIITYDYVVCSILS